MSSMSCLPAHIFSAVHCCYHIKDSNTLSDFLTCLFFFFFFTLSSTPSKSTKTSCPPPQKPLTLDYDGDMDM